MVTTQPPMKPSQVFLGDRSISLRYPTKTPAHATKHRPEVDGLAVSLSVHPNACPAANTGILGRVNQQIQGACSQS